MDLDRERDVNDNDVEDVCSMVLTDGKMCWSDRGRDVLIGVLDVVEEDFA